MKSPRATMIGVVGFFCVFSTFHLRAQFYAPETEYHDKVQRLFVVELARVLAWRENLHDGKIQKITYSVATDTNEVTSWKLRWLGPDGKPVRSVEVHYAKSLMLDGPQFYREVFKQEWSGAKWTALPEISGQELSQRFWSGADRSGMSREEGLNAMFKTVGTKPGVPEAEYIPGLAGLMSHSALPGLAGGVTLDAMLLSRAAAWLCLSEAMLAKPATPTDEMWAPILFLAGRENAAMALWGKSPGFNQNKKDTPQFYSWWNFFLEKPAAKAAFLLATDPAHRPFAMPILVYYARTQWLGETLANVVYPIYKDKQGTFFRLYNYGPFFASRTGISGGRILEGAWPALSRKAWVDMLRQFPPTSLDYTNYQPTLNDIPEPALVQPVDEADKSLIGLKAAAPLLELSYEQGEGELIPVGSVTARDLLNYGWEMNGLQMGSRYNFVKNNWGVYDLAKSIFDAATRDIQGQSAFFKNDFQKSAFNLQSTLFRLQMVDGMSWMVGADIQPFSKDMNDAKAARLFYERCWLRPYDVRWQAWTLCYAQQREEMVQVLKQYHQQCGPLSDIVSLEYLSDWFSQSQAEQVNGLIPLKTQLADSIPVPIPVKLNALFEERYAHMSNLDRAREYERLFWQDPDSGLEERVITGYIAARAFDSAKRFYLEVRTMLDLGVGFSNNTGPQLWAVGCLEKDENLMSTALKDSDTGSYSAMMTAFWNFAVHDDSQGMEQEMDELVDRYESQQGPESTGRTLKGFIPLIPALKDPNNPDHEKALDYFGKSNKGSVLRVILILKYGLNKEDAIRFLGGPETDRFRHVVVLYLQNDSGDMLRAYSDFNETSTSDAAWVIATWLAHKAVEPSAVIADQDLKTPGAQTIQAAVLEKLKAN
jgi:hypothetical protein